MTEQTIIRQLTLVGIEAEVTICHAILTVSCGNSRYNAATAIEYIEPLFGPLVDRVNAPNGIFLFFRKAV